MRVVFAVNWSMPYDDAAVYQSVNTAHALALQGVHVTVLLPSRKHDCILSAEHFAGILGRPAAFAIEQYSGWPLLQRLLPTLAWFLRCRFAKSARDSDVIIARTPAALVFGAGPGRRVVIDTFRTWPDNLPLLRAAFRRGISSSQCVGLLLHSQFAEESFLRLGVDPRKLTVAHNGAEIDRFRTALTQLQARARHGFPDRGPVVVYSGRLVKWKGVDRLLDMARARPGIHFVLVGSKENGPIEKEAAAIGNVRIMPWCPPETLAELFAAADILALPPTRVGLETKKTVLPIKTFAYLAAGKPILAPRLPDTHGVLIDGETALLVEPDDINSALAGLDRLLQDSALSRKLSVGSFALASSKTWDARARLIAKFLKERLSP